MDVLYNLCTVLWVYCITSLLRSLCGGRERRRPALHLHQADQGGRGQGDQRRQEKERRQLKNIYSHPQFILVFSSLVAFSLSLLCFLMIDIFSEFQHLIHSLSFNSDPCNFITFSLPLFSSCIGSVS